MILKGETFSSHSAELCLNAGLHDMDILIASSVTRLQAFFSQECQGFKETLQHLELHLRLSRKSLQT